MTVDVQKKQSPARLRRTALLLFALIAAVALALVGAGTLAHTPVATADETAEPPALADLQRWELAAAEISEQILERHLPHGTILDPVFLSPESDEIIAYSRAGDSAIWTGHYLAAESFRYRVTGAPEALENAARALAGIQLLVEVTETGLLARAALPVDSPFLPPILREERRHGAFRGSWRGENYYWIANTSRDQYCGVFFGLSAAFELIDKPDLRSISRRLVTKMLDFLLEKHWLVRMPDGRVSTLFHLRPDQQLTFLQIGRQVNPERFDPVYREYRGNLAAFAVLALATDVWDDHNTYFQFNLDAINLYSLLRLEESSLYRRFYEFGYDLFRRTTDDHGNAHFNMIDRALRGIDARRDAETIELLEAWLRRPRRDPYLDLRGQFPACGPDRACEPIPVEQRIHTDFLWQRSPFLLFGGGHGTIEGPGIDFILPYWMARFYGVI